MQSGQAEVCIAEILSAEICPIQSWHPVRMPHAVLVPLRDIALQQCDRLLLVHLRVSPVPLQVGTIHSPVCRGAVSVNSSYLSGVGADGRRFPRPVGVRLNVEVVVGRDHGNMGAVKLVVAEDEFYESMRDYPRCGQQQQVR